MDPELAQKAIECALRSDWEGAITLNSQILDTQPDDIDALNRLSKAYLQSGDLKSAKLTNAKARSIDPTNLIAAKTFEKLKSFNKNDVGSSTPMVNSATFLEEPGKTKIINLIHISDKKCLSQLFPGQIVDLNPHSHRVNVNTTNSKYIGRLPDDLAARVRSLVKLGNKYEAFVKTVTDSEVKIFIRETHKSSRAKDTTSFPAEKIQYVTFTPPELVHKEAPVTEQTENQA